MRLGGKSADRVPGVAEEDDDRDALTWEGDDQVEDLVAEHDDEPEVATSAAAPVEAEPDPARSRDRLVAGALLVLAVAASVGWIVVAIGNPVQQPSLLGLAMYQLGELLSIVAPVLWWLTAGRLAPNPLPWRLVGLVVTAPWPLAFWVGA